MSLMAMQQSLDHLYNQWFQLADVDRDGRVGGGEAVAFFMPKAGLSQAVLGQIWEMGASGAPFLDTASFRRICQLIWYAQLNGNMMPPDSRGVLMKIISGMATLPPPTLAGLDVPHSLRTMQPVGIDLPQAAPAAAPQYSAAPTGYSASSAGDYSSHQQYSHQGPMVARSGGYESGSFTAGPTGQFGSGLTGHVPQQAPVKGDSFGSAPTGQPQYPAITNQLAAKYAGLYESATKDASGGIGGGEVLRMVAGVNVDRSVKKQAWDLVAGNRAVLTPQEFFTFMYLLDLYTVQHSMPRQLPSGIFPPGIHLALQAAGLPVPISLQPVNVEHVPLQQQNPVENLALQAEAYKDAKWSMEAHEIKEVDPLAAMPRVPPKAAFDASEPATYDAAKRMPDLDPRKISAMSNGGDADRLKRELAEAGSQDKALFEAEQVFANSKAEAEFYQNSLQQLLLFKSRSARALLDTQSRADAAQREAQETRARYEQMYAEARAASTNHESLQRHITEAMGSKAEWESKLAVLHQELAALANATPELLEQLQYEIGELEGAVHEVEEARAAEEAKTSGLRASKEQLTSRLAEVKDVLKAAEGARESAQQSLDRAKGELDFTKTGEDSESLLAALADVAAVYKSLYTKAIGAGLKPPPASRVASKEDSVWEREDLLAAQDWCQFKDEGWTVIQDMPDLPDAFGATYLLEQLPGPLPEVITPLIVRDDPFIDIVEEAEEDSSDSDAEDAAASGEEQQATEDEGAEEAAKEASADADGTSPDAAAAKGAGEEASLMGNSEGSAPPADGEDEEATAPAPDAEVVDGIRERDLVPELAGASGEVTAPGPVTAAPISSSRAALDADLFMFTEPEPAAPTGDGAAAATAAEPEPELEIETVEAPTGNGADPSETSRGLDDTLPLPPDSSMQFSTHELSVSRPLETPKLGGDAATSQMGGVAEDQEASAAIPADKDVSAVMLTPVVDSAVQEVSPTGGSGEVAPAGSDNPFASSLVQGKEEAGAPQPDLESNPFKSTSAAEEPVEAVSANNPFGSSDAVAKASVVQSSAAVSDNPFASGGASVGVQGSVPSAAPEVAADGAVKLDDMSSKSRNQADWAEF